MTIFASDSFLTPVPANVGLYYPHVSDSGYSEFEHSNRNFADVYLLTSDPIALYYGYNTGHIPGRLLFDLGDGAYGLLTQIDRCILCLTPLTTNDYEAQLDLWIDPATMGAEGIIALRAQEGIGAPYHMAFAGIRWVIAGEELTVEFIEADGSATSTTLLDTVPLVGPMRRVKLVAQVQSNQITAFVDGVQIGATTAITMTSTLGSMESGGEVYFVIQPTDDGTVPDGADQRSYGGPFSGITVSYLAVGSVGALTVAHQEGSVLPWNYDWAGNPDVYRPMLLPKLRGFGTDMLNIGTMPLPDPEDDELVGGMLPPLVGGSEVPSGGGPVGEGPNEIFTMGGTLPMLIAHMHFAPPWLWNFNITLPQLQVQAYGGNFARITLPMPTVQMAITIPNNMRFNVRLPLLAAFDDQDFDTEDLVWRGSVGMVWQFAITLPGITTRGRFGGWRFAITLPMLELGATGGGIHLLTNNSLTFDIRLPRLRASAAFTTIPAGLRAYVVLPALMMAHGLSGTILLPALRVSARFSTPLLPGAVETRRGWAMNLQNMAVTEFEGFEFRAMTFAHNSHYGVGLDGGLYRMGGDTDAGEPIAWAWESGLADFGVNAQKGLMALYVDGLFENSATFIIQADTARRIYGHKARGNVANHQPHRIPLGKGVRTRNIGIGMADEAGGYLELDKITPEYVITSRNL